MVSALTKLEAWTGIAFILVVLVGLLFAVSYFDVAERTQADENDGTSKVSMGEDLKTVSLEINVEPSDEGRNNATYKENSTIG